MTNGGGHARERERETRVMEATVTVAATTAFSLLKKEILRTYTHPEKHKK